MVLPTPPLEMFRMFISKAAQLQHREPGKDVILMKIGISRAYANAEAR